MPDLLATTCARCSRSRVPRASTNPAHRNLLSTATAQPSGWGWAPPARAGPMRSQLEPLGVLPSQIPSIPVGRRRVVTSSEALPVARRIERGVQLLVQSPCPPAEMR